MPSSGNSNSRIRRSVHCWRRPSPVRLVWTFRSGIQIWKPDRRVSSRYSVQENPRYVIVYDDGFNYLTKMCLTTMREASFAMIARAKEQGRIVIVSSSDAADHYEKYITHGADFVIKGEGEDTLKELLTTLENEDDVYNHSGHNLQAG